MSDLQHFTKLLNEVNPSLGRREFIRNSLIAGVGAALLPLGSTPSVLAQTEGGMEEIVVIGTDDAEMHRQIEKDRARAAASFVQDAGYAAVTLGSALVGGGFALAPESGGLTLTLVFAGAVWVVDGIGLFTIAFLLDLVAADPPRSNYKVDTLLEGPFYSSRLLKATATTELPEHLVTTDALLVATRRLWDSLELWQGARIAEDATWINLHADNFWASFETFTLELQALPASLRAALDSLKKATSGPSYQEVIDASNKLSGQNILDIDGVRQVLEQGVNWNSALFDSLRDDVRNVVRTATVQPFSETKFDNLLANLEESAGYFASV